MGRGECKHLFGFNFKNPDEAEAIDTESLDYFDDAELEQAIYFNFCPWCGLAFQWPESEMIN